MKKLYWRPQKLSVRVLVLVAFVALGLLGAVETFRVKEKQRYYREKRAAARLCLSAFQAIKEERVARGLTMSPETDPAQSGLIGELLSPVTTNTGHLPAKQTSVNPNFAAAVVDMLMRAGVKKGDLIAAGFSGSFPALNVAVLAAMETLKLRPVIIGSAGASQWGANHDRFTWPAMERSLRQRGLISSKSIAFSIGGIDDRGLGMSERGREIVREVIESNGYEFLETHGFEDSLEKRMALYGRYAAGAECKTYINVGGGTVSVGTKVGKLLFSPGLNMRPPRGPQIDSVMTRFAKSDVPVIHLSKVSKLAERYGFPQMPPLMPLVGEGKIFWREAYDSRLAAGALVTLLVLLVAFLRLDWGYRLLTSQPKESEPSRPEPMV
jgi:poly-gamma-glutamate system protein